MPLPLCIQMGSQYYCQASLDDAPEDRLAMIRQFIQTATDLMAPPDAPPEPAPPPDPSMMPPDGQMPPPEEFLDAPALEALADLHRFEKETRLFTSPDEERVPPSAAAYRLAFQRADRSQAHLILRFRRRTEHHDWLVSELSIDDPPPN